MLIISQAGEDLWQRKRLHLHDEDALMTLDTCIAKWRNNNNQHEIIITISASMAVSGA